MRGKGAIAACVGRAAQAVALVLLGALAACSGVGTWYDRHGVRAVIDADAVAVSTANRQRFMNAFIDRARLPGEPVIGSRDWYLVMDAGFSYVNEVCDAYVQDLFMLNRDRDKIKSGLVILDKAANAIMFATGSSQVAMTVVAQAFGIASGGADVFANSYLYRIEPSALQKLIKESQSAYRAAAYAKAQEFTYPTAVEQGIQGYLSLCLPVTIEARVNDVLNRTRIVGDNTQATGAAIDLISTTDQVRSRAAVATSQGLIFGRPDASVLGGSDQRVGPKKPTRIPEDEDKNRFSDEERSMSQKSIKALQATLCEKADGDLGPRGSDTRKAIRLLAVYQKKRNPSEIITTDNRDIYDKIVDEVRDCKKAGFRNVYEVAVFGPAVGGSGNIEDLQNMLKVRVSGKLDSATRAAISKVPGANGDFLTPELHLKIMTPVPGSANPAGGASGPGTGTATGTGGATGTGAATGAGGAASGTNPTTGNGAAKGTSPAGNTK